MERNLFEKGLGINQKEIEELLLESSLPQEKSRELRSLPEKDWETQPEHDLVGMYLKEIDGSSRILRPEEEVDLAKLLAKGRSAKRKLRNSNLNGDKKQALEDVIRKADVARELFIKHNRRLVVSIAKRYKGRGVAFIDLIQEGNIGLMTAVEKYDHKKGYKFSTYGSWWIRQKITRTIVNHGRTIRVPVHLYGKIGKLNKQQRLLVQRLGREPTIDELAEALDEKPTKVALMIKVSWFPLSLEAPVGDEEDSELGMFIEDETSPSPDLNATYEDLKSKIKDALETLTPREAKIIRLRFGLENGKEYTLEEVGQKFGLTRERIRQIEAKALRRLRHPVRSRKLRDLSY